MVDFSHIPAMTGYFAPTRFEADVFDCEVAGEIPSELDGAFYRLHPDWLYPPNPPDDIILAADGYASVFRFKDGRVHYRGRYVRTERLRNQLEAGRNVYGYYRNPFTDDPSVADPANPHRRTTANTTPVAFGGKLYATKEDGLPYELDPATLATRAQTDFGGRWKSQTFTAHPKIDPVTGEMIAFGYEASGLASRDVFLASLNPAGEVTWEVSFEVPYTSMLHDMCITERHVIIPGGGCVTSLDRLHDGKLHWAWDSRLPSYYGVIPRGGEAKDLRWFTGPERSIVHTANAWSEGDRVVMEAPMADGNTWPWFEDLGGRNFSMPINTIRRVTFDMASKDDRAKEELVVERPVTSFTRVDERYMGLPYRYAYVQYADVDRPFRPRLPTDPRIQPNNTVGRFDLRDGEIRSCFIGETHLMQEPSFIPRAGSGEEGDGWLVGVAHNLSEMRSEMILIDAQAMEEVARVILPFRTPGQVHGVWAGADQLGLTDPPVLA